MTLDTQPAIPTGRTWRDLPPEPPFGEPSPPAPRGPAVPPPETPSRTERFRWWPWAVLAAVLGAALLVLVAWAPWTGATPTTALGAAGGEPGTTAPTFPPGQEPVAAVAHALLPSVVQIETPRGLGSGFVYDADQGLVLTAAHVVEGARSVRVRLDDGRTVPGTVLGGDVDRDVAVVRIPAGGLVAAPLALGEPVEVGETVVAIGSPFGLDQTVTSGIVSALDRSLHVGGREITGLIQTDAAINRGNSGGPLANLEGKVIGINVAIASASGGSNGIGFAVPIDTARQVADTVVSGGGAAGVPPAESPRQGNSLGDLLDELRRGLPFDPSDPLSLLPPELRDLMDRLLGPDPFAGPGGGAAPSTPGLLVRPGSLPDGYEVTATRVTTSGGTTRQVTTLRGPAGTVAVRATSGAVAADVVRDASGEEVTVRGAPGRLEEGGGRIRLVWAEREDLVVEIIAPEGMGRAAVLALAAGLEVAS